MCQMQYSLHVAFYSYSHTRLTCSVALCPMAGPFSMHARLGSN